MRKSLWTRLAVPLTLVSLILLGLHTLWDLDGLLVNLSASFLTIIVTVFYVDWVLRTHETGRWTRTDQRIAQRLEVFVNALVSALRVSLGFGPDIMDQSVVLSQDIAAGHKETLRIAEHVLSPAMQARVEQLDEASWKLLARQLQWIWTEAERLLDRFSYRLSPRQIELLLDIQTAAQYALTFYQTFPDIAGVPADRLPEGRTSPELLQEFGCETTAKQLRKLLDLARQLDDA